MPQVITQLSQAGKQKVTMSDILFQRLENLRLHQNWTWAQVGEAIGVKTAMIMMIKSGKRKLSTKALFRLKQVEREVGLGPPPNEEHHRRLLRVPSVAPALEIPSEPVNFSATNERVVHELMSQAKSLREEAERMLKLADRLAAQADRLKNIEID